MVNRRQGRSRRWTATAVLAGSLLAALPATGQQGEGTTEALEWALLEAETALGHRELQIAESHYRAALLEGWYLRGLLEAMAEDLPAAAASLARAAHSAAIPSGRAETALALVRLRLGEEDDAIRALRLAVRQEPGDATVRSLLVRALAVAGKPDDARQELEELRARAPRKADALAAALDAAAANATGLDATGLETAALLPAIDAGALAGQSAPQRAELHQRLAATLARINSNLGVIQERAGRPDRALSYFAQAEAITAAAGTAAAEARALGKIELRREPPPRRVDRQRLDPAELREASPESLRPVILQIDDGRLEAAETELRRLLTEKDDPAVRDLLGTVLSHQERYPEAEAELLAATAAAPERLPARQHLARIYLLLGRDEEALEQLRQAAELGPLDRDLAFELAAAEQAAGRRPAANHQLRSLSRRFGSARALMQLSAIATELRNFKLALGYAEQARAAAPSSEEVLALHTLSALAVRIPSTAAKSVEPLAKMHPDVGEFQYLLGKVWMELGNMGEAAEALLAAVTLDPELEEALVPLGLALNHERRHDHARTYLERFLSVHPDDLEALAALAEAEERLGDTDSAARHAAAVLERDGDQPTAHLVIAMLHMRQGNFGEARTALEKAVAADPELAKAHYQLSQACARLGDTACAKQHLELYQQANLGPEGSFVPLGIEPGSAAESAERQR